MRRIGLRDYLAVTLKFKAQAALTYGNLDVAKRAGRRGRGPGGRQRAGRAGRGLPRARAPRSGLAVRRHPGELIFGR